MTDIITQAKAEELFGSRITARKWAPVFQELTSLLTYPADAALDCPAFEWLITKLEEEASTLQKEKAANQKVISRRNFLIAGASVAATVATASYIGREKIEKSVRPAPEKIVLLLSLTWAALPAGAVLAGGYREMKDIVLETRIKKLEEKFNAIYMLNSNSDYQR